MKLRVHWSEGYPEHPCLVVGAWYSVSGIRCLVSGVWCLVPGAWCLVSGACVWCLVSGAGIGVGGWVCCS
ncbi:hypothetical protein FDZ84_10470 [Saccharopolyspora sp. ASAGF58]|nr:hypothetical protein FDZ84_10470 [Saccharopolyspora sp. ASAGF58]